MRVGLFLGISGVVAGLFGVEFLLLSEFALQQFAISTQAHNLMQARYFGGALLTMGLLFWSGRNLHDDRALKVILQVGLLGSALGAIISTSAILTGLQNQLAWGTVAIYSALVGGNLYFLSSASRRA